VVISLVDTIAVLSAFILALSRFQGHVEAAQTVAFATLVCSELLRAFTSRSEYHSVSSIGPFSNRWMVLATTLSFVLLLLVVYVPFLQSVFNTVPLNFRDWLSMAPFIVMASVAAEVTKFFLRRRMEGKPAIPAQA